MELKARGKGRKGLILQKVDSDQEKLREMRDKAVKEEGVKED